MTRFIARRAVLFGLPLGLVCSVAGADEPGPSKRDVSRDLHVYYSGELTSAHVVAVLGALSFAGGLALVTKDGDFARGLGWPLLVLGALEGVGALFYGVQVHDEIARYQRELDRDPAAYKRAELGHMHGTTSRFVFYRLTELGLALGGVAMASVGFAANADLWKGLGIGVASIALPFLVIDTVNNGRAARYTDQVRDFQPVPERTPVSVLPQAPLQLSYRGTLP